MEKIEITLYAEGERTLLEIPPETTVAGLVAFARTLQGQNVAGFRVNGRPATSTQQLQEGDKVSTIPLSGQLA